MNSIKRLYYMSDIRYEYACQTLSRLVNKYSPGGSIGGSTDISDHSVLSVSFDISVDYDISDTYMYVSGLGPQIKIL